MSFERFNDSITTFGIHSFADSAIACDAYQISEAVKFGDTLVIKSERVVGVACTEAFAISAEQGEFYDFTWDAPVTEPNVLLILVNSIRAAVTEAKRLGIAINPAFAEFAESH